jgi:hypothetical protein
MIFDGIIDKPGAGSASKDLSILLPIIAQEYDELRHAHPGTINVRLRELFDLKIDFKTDPIVCAPPILHRIEFVRVEFEFPLGKSTKAWIFQPYGYHWGERNDRFLLEILTGKLDEVKPGEPCKINVFNNGLGSSSTSVHYLRWKFSQIMKDFFRTG